MNDIDRYRDRRNKRIQSRFDFEVGVDPPDEPGDRGAIAHGNTRLPYGLCKAAGIDTTGMTPREAWEVLSGKTGVTAKEAYKSLKESGKADIHKMAKGKSGGLSPTDDNEGSPGTEELGNRGPIPEPFVKGVKPAPTKKTATLSDNAVAALNAIEGKAIKTESDIQAELDKLQAELGENGRVGFVTPSGRFYTFEVGHPMTASNIQYFKNAGGLKMFAGKDEAEATERFNEMVESWKNSDDLDDVVRATSVRLVQLKRDKGTGKISADEYKKASRAAIAEQRKAALKKYPTYNDCKTLSEISTRMFALGDFKSRPTFSSTADLENAREAATSAEHMFNIFPSMRGRVEGLNGAKYRKYSYAWVSGTAESGIFVSTSYMSDRKKLTETYANDVKKKFHPPGTDSGAIIYHEFAHVIDQNLSAFVGHRGGFPGYPKGTMLSTVIATEVAKELGMSVFDMKSSVSGYAKKVYKKMPAWKDMEFLSECMAEYVGSAHPRPVAAKTAEKLFTYMRKYWGDGAVNENAMVEE